MKIIIKILVGKKRYYAVVMNELNEFKNKGIIDEQSFDIMVRDLKKECKIKN